MDLEIYCKNTSQQENEENKKIKLMNNINIITTFDIQIKKGQKMYSY